MVTEIQGLGLVQDEAAGFNLETRDIGVGAGKSEREYDFQSEVARMLEAAKAGHGAAGGGIKIDEIGFAGALLDADSLLDPVEKLLRQAQGLIREGQYGAALDILDQLLAENPNHHEAIYLKALCQSSRDEEKEDDALQALQTLRLLRGVSLENALSGRVGALLETLRGRRFVPLLLNSILMKDQPDVLIAFLRQEVDLDPGSSMANFLLAGELLANDRLEESIAAADAGLAMADPRTRGHLEDLRSTAQKRLVRRALLPALKLYREGKYARAFGAISELPAAIRPDRLAQNFESYVGALSGGATGFWSSMLSRSAARTPMDVRPPGTAREIDDLGFFIVRSDLDFLRETMGRDGRTLDDVTRVEARTRDAVGFAPWFPFIHFVYAQCVYGRLNESLHAGNPPAAEKVEADLLNVKTHLDYAVRDPEIKDVSEMHESITKLLAAINESKAAGKHFAAFKNKMDYLGRHKISNYTELTDAKQFFNRLLTDAKSDRAKFINQQSIEAIDHLISQIQTVLKMLNRN